MTSTKTTWFTLVELIIVITILVILWTISFMSFSNYTKTTRDANRLITLQNIEKWLQTYFIRSGKYPEPDNKIEITSSWTTYSYQWIIWDWVSRLIQLQANGDPMTQESYQYSVNTSRKKMQLLWMFEDNQTFAIIPNIYATLDQRVLKWFWDIMQPVFVNEDNSQIQTWFELLIKTWAKAIFQDEVIYSSWFADITNKEDTLATFKFLNQQSTYIWKVWYILQVSNQTSIIKNRLEEKWIVTVSSSWNLLWDILSYNPDYIVCDRSAWDCNFTVLNDLYSQWFNIITYGNDTTNVILPIEWVISVWAWTPSWQTLPDENHFISRWWDVSWNSWGDTRRWITIVHPDAIVIARDNTTWRPQVLYLEQPWRWKWIHFHPNGSPNKELFERALAYMSR